MRVTSYNILDGGVGRADPLGEVIQAQRADVVVLIEADDVAVVDRIAGRLGMDVIVARGTDHAVAVLTAWPIVQSVNHAGLAASNARCLLSVTLLTPGGAELPVDVVHLVAGVLDSDENRRQREVAYLLAASASLRDARTPHLIVGDLNATSPLQRVDPARCSDAVRSGIFANGGRLPTRVVQQILDAGYVDTLARHRPRDVPDMMTFTTHRPGQRVDYIFAHGFADNALVDAWIETDRLAEFASDHFPVGAEFKL